MEAIRAHMRGFLFLASFVATFLSGPPALATGSTLPSTFAIQVRQGDWGTARAQDIETVLRSVTNVLLPYFPQHVSDRIRVESSKQGPRVFSEKSPDGAYLVLLNVKDTRWDQFAYQFSHELCHIFTNIEHREIGDGVIARDHQWFEETLCEAVSLFTLKQVASNWERSPPHLRWKNYAPAFREYAEQLLSENHRRLPPDKSIGEWYADNREALKSNPYLREKNEILASSLLTLLENTPGSLQAIGYLNLEKSSFDKSFSTYLESWYSCCPEAGREFVGRIFTLLEGRRERNSGAAVVTLSASGEFSH
jgi:hypothetical protein